MKVDRRLIEGCLKNKRSAQRKLYDLLMPYLTVVCQRYLRNGSDLPDALQESFIDLFKNMEQYDAERAEFHTWATRIAIHRSLKMNRSYDRAEMTELSEEWVEDTHIPGILEQMDDAELLEYLKNMPVSFWEVFNLHIVDGFSHREIAGMLDIHESLSRQRLSRAKKWIKTRLTEEGEMVMDVQRRSQ